MHKLSRRTLLKNAAFSGVAIASVSSPSWSEQTTPTPRKGRIKQSVSRWCYKDIPLDKLCAYSAQIGCKAIDLLGPEDYEVPRRYGLICAMGYGGGGDIPNALNRVENHAKIEEGLRKNIPLAAKAGIPNVITFSGNRAGMSDEEGAKNTIIGLNRIKKIGEDNGVVICLELLNSKVNHPDYQCDHTSWGVEVCKRVNSPSVKLLYDIYHMQIMEGDVIHTIRDNIKWIGHFHTGGVPGRHEIDDSQELNYRAVAKAIVETGYTGWLAHEYNNPKDPRKALEEALDICDA
jgi:hydroxypyruvate isomerase